MLMGTGAAAIVARSLAIVGSVVTLVGALKMKSLQSFGLAMTSSILAMVPCTSGCCLIGLPMGIWAIVVLNDKDVKSAFE